MARIAPELRKVWRAEPNSMVDLIIRVQGDLQERADALEERGVKVRRAFRLTHRLSIRCRASRALGLSRFRWIDDIEIDKAMSLFGR